MEEFLENSRIRIETDTYLLNQKKINDAKYYEKEKKELNKFTRNCIIVAVVGTILKIIQICYF